MHDPHKNPPSVSVVLCSWCEERVFVHGCITDWLANRHDLSSDYYSFHTGDVCMMRVYWVRVKPAWSPFICNQSFHIMNTFGGHLSQTHTMPADAEVAYNNQPSLGGGSWSQVGWLHWSEGKESTLVKLCYCAGLNGTLPLLVWYRSKQLTIEIISNESIDFACTCFLPAYFIILIHSRNPVDAKPAQMSETWQILQPQCENNSQRFHWAYQPHLLATHWVYLFISSNKFSVVT